MPDRRVADSIRLLACARRANRWKASLPFQEIVVNTPDFEFSLHLYHSTIEINFGKVSSRCLESATLVVE